MSILSLRSIIFSISEQNKETSAPTSRNSKVPSFNSNSRQGELTKSSLKHSNSCSTIYIDDSTVSQPNLRAMIKCVSIAIHSHIVLRKSNKTINIFDERLHPLTVKLFIFDRIYFHSCFSSERSRSGRLRSPSPRTKKCLSILKNSLPLSAVDRRMRNRCFGKIRRKTYFLANFHVFSQRKPKGLSRTSSQLR